MPNNTQKLVKSATVLLGRRIFCLDSELLHYEQEDVAYFQFTDYSWPCNGCKQRHLSSSYYSTDGETIYVTGSIPNRSVNSRRAFND
jgi:hypothetical protein